MEPCGGWKLWAEAQPACLRRWCWAAGWCLAWWPGALTQRTWNPFSTTVHSVGLFLARASIFADMAVLLPQVRGKRARGFAGWMAGTVLFVGITILLTAGCLGRYAYTQNFPVYVLASLTQVRSLQRLDAVFTGVWMMGLVVKLAWDLYACRVCFWALWRGNKARSRWALWATAGAVLALAMLGAGLRPVQRVLMNTWLLALCTGAVGAVPPLLVWLAGCFQRKKGGG